MSWVAKGVLTGNIYSMKFSSVYDCQTYIDNTLIYCDETSAENFSSLSAELSCFIDRHNLIDKLKNIYKTEFITIDLSIETVRNRVLSFCRLLYNDPIRCFNVEQNRFATSWDF